MAKKKKEILKIPSANPDEQPATRKMLWAVRDELKSMIRTHDRKMDALDSKMTSLEAKMDSAEHRMDARFSELALLLEEQNSNNRIVLEGLQALWQRQERVEGAQA